MASDQRDYRRTNSAKSSRTSSNQLPQLHHRRKTPPSIIRSRSSVMHRSNSEPTISFNNIGEDNRTLSTPEEVLYRPQTCTDCLLLHPQIQSPQNLQKYNREAKVVVNVMVEGSPGAVRVMLKLGSTVEEAIKVVVNKYEEEWRSPLLDKHAASTFQLHQSYFSLQCLDRSTLIGDLGGRSFYLRKGGEFGDVEMQYPPSPVATQFPLIFLSGFIAMNINKIIRRTRKIWTLLGCMGA